MPLKKVLKQDFDGGYPVLCIVIEIPEYLKDFGNALVHLSRSVTNASPTGHR